MNSGGEQSPVEEKPKNKVSFQGLLINWMVWEYLIYSIGPCLAFFFVLNILVCVCIYHLIFVFIVGYFESWDSSDEGREPEAEKLVESDN